MATIKAVDDQKLMRELVNGALTSLLVKACHVLPRASDSGSPGRIMAL